MNIFITGANGFLGKALTAALQREGEHRLVRPASRELDLTDAAALERFPHPRYDRIYHLACWTQAGDFCLHHPGEQWMINQQDQHQRPRLVAEDPTPGQVDRDWNQLLLLRDIAADRG